MKKNVFVLALEEEQRAELESINNPDEYAFHGLLDVATLVEPDHIDIPELLAKARAELRASGGTVDAIIAHWDFPTSVLAPILCHELGLPSPSLRSVLACEHKYWSRLEQRACIPEYIPRFCLVDPFAADPLATVDIPFPFWIKPVKSWSSQLGFLVENERDFAQAIEKTRARIHHFGDAFDQVLTMVEVPEACRAASGNTCIVEELIHGRQVAPEGSMARGEFRVHGTFDMHRDFNGKSFSRLQYPSTVPAAVQQRMQDVTERFLRHIGFDDGCFNSEFMWDEATDTLMMVEVNTRISQSHSEMFLQVDGMSNHEVAIDVALGVTPQMPRGRGRYRVAAKFIIPWPEDGIVRRVPSAEEIAALRARFPLLDVRLEARQGMRLSDIPNQDSYCFQLGVLYLGADSERELLDRYDACLAGLRFEIEPLRGQATHGG